MSMRQNSTRKSDEFLRKRRQASALEIGSAAVAGEAWAQAPDTWKAKAEIGLQIAVALTRQGVARPTRTNRFEIVTAA